MSGNLAKAGPQPNSTLYERVTQCPSPAAGGVTAWASVSPLVKWGRYAQLTGKFNHQAGKPLSWAGLLGGMRRE